MLVASLMTPSYVLEDKCLEYSIKYPIKIKLIGKKGLVTITLLLKSLL